MPEDIGKRSFIPSRGYHVQLYIKKKDYSNDVSDIRIVSSIVTPYQMIFLTINLDQNDIILEKLYGQDSIRLRIQLIEQDQIPKDSIDFELIYISSTYKTVMKKISSDGTDKLRIPVNIIAVPSMAFAAATKTINKVYTNMKMKKLLSSIVEDFLGTGAVIDSDGINTKDMDQIIIPPKSFYKCIKYIDDTFGIYEGPAGVSIDRFGKVYIFNLNKRMNKGQTFTIYQLTQDGDNGSIIRKCIDGKNFYTFDIMDHSYSGNAKFANLASTQLYITKPDNALYHSFGHTLNKIMSEYGVMSKNSKSYIDLSLATRTRIYTRDAGNDYDETFAISRTTSQLANLATVKFTLQRNIRVENLMNVGNVVQFTTGHKEMTDLTGKYILKASDIRFEKAHEWFTSAKVQLIRSNKTL